MKTFKEFLKESNGTSHTELVKDFLKSATPQEKIYYTKRDNCGPACLDLINYAKKKNINLTRVRGYFRGDSVVHSKKDFTPEMKNEFSSSGLDFNNREHRKQWIENNPKYSEEWKKIPHYWTKDDQGRIHDPSGHSQIITKNYASDLHPSRYEEE